MCSVNIRRLLFVVVCSFGFSLCAATTAQADIINVTYSLTGSGGGDPMNPPLIGNATGSLSPLGSVTWSDQVFPDFATGTGEGTFVMTFADGDSLFGTLLYVPDFSQFPIAPIAQFLTVTGGTGEFLWYHGTLTGVELSNALDGTFTSSGSGALDTSQIPEPESIVLLATGLVSLFAYRNARVDACAAAGDISDVR